MNAAGAAPRAAAGAVPADAEFAFNEADFQRVRRMIHARAGIDLGANKTSMVYSRLSRRLREIGCASFSDYLDALQRDAHVLERGQVREHRGNLERPDHAEPGDLRRRERGDVAALVRDAAASRLEKLREKVEAGRLAGAVGANQRVDRAATHLQRDVLDCREAAELLSQALRLKDDVLGHATSPFDLVGVRDALF